MSVPPPSNKQKTCTPTEDAHIKKKTTKLQQANGIDSISADEQDQQMMVQCMQLGTCPYDRSNGWECAQASSAQSVRSLLGSCGSEKRRGHKVYNQSVSNLWGLIDFDPFPIIIVDALMHQTRNAWQFHYHRHREACPQKPKLYVFSPKIWGGV